MPDLVKSLVTRGTADVFCPRCSRKLCQIVAREGRYLEIMGGVGKGLEILELLPEGGYREVDTQRAREVLGGAPLGPTLRLPIGATTVYRETASTRPELWCLHCERVGVLEMEDIAESYGARRPYYWPTKSENSI